LLALQESGQAQFEMVAPSITILAEPPVAWADEVVKKRGTLEVAQAYLEFLYTQAGQEIAAKHFFRPRLDTVLQKHAAAFPKVNFFTIDEVFGGWKKAQKIHFDNGGIFDQIQQRQR